MLRSALRNVGVMLGVGVPVLVVGALFIGWLVTPPITGDARLNPSLGVMLTWFIFLYPIAALPALVVVIVHQLVLAALPPELSSRTTRLIIFGTALTIAVVIAIGVTFVSTRQRGIALGAALLPSAIAYGLMARPLRRRLT